MSTGGIEDLAVAYDPGQLQALVIRRRTQVRSRVISLIITLVVLLAIYLWRGDQLEGAGFFALYGLVLVVSLGWLAVVAVIYLRARRELASVGEGTAVRIGRAGVQVADLGASWPEVASIGAVKGGVGRGPVLRLRLTDGREAGVGLDQIAVRPATLDSAARAFSGGRHGVDLSALD